MLSHLSTFKNPIPISSSSPLKIQTETMAGKDNRGKHAAEEVPEENMLMSQRLHCMR